MKNFKKVISLLAVMALVMSLFAGISVQAENGANVDDKFVYQASKMSWKQYACMVSSDDDAYICVETTAADPYFYADVGAVTADYPILAVKYVFPSASTPHTNQLYFSTTGGLPWTKCHFGHTFVANDKWTLDTYNIRELVPAIEDQTLKDFRFLGAADAGKVAYFAYFGFFKTVEDAKAYDAWYTEEWDLEDLESEEREESIPDAYDSAAELPYARQTVRSTSAP